MYGTARLNRLFAESGKCLDVAIDHGVFNEAGFLKGIEHIRNAVRHLANAGPDALQLTPGMAHFLQSIPGKNKPALVMRADVANVYGRELSHFLFDELIENAVERAIMLDAACVVVNLLCLPGQPELHRQCVQNVSRIKTACERYGMPLMVEPLIMKPSNQGGYMVDGEISRILPLVRQAVEMGADIVKADPCDDPEQFHEIVAIACGIPVLPRGGGTVGEKDVLSRTSALIKQGARGIVYGRNIIQHRRPDLMTRALMKIVHENATVQEAMVILAT